MSSTKERINYKVIDKFQCLICFGYLLPPIYQCAREHLLCIQCNQITCSQCGESALNRCRNEELESVIKNELFPCIFLSEGCEAKTKPDQVMPHRITCEYAPAQHCKMFGIECEKAYHVHDLMNHLTNSHQLMPVAHKEATFTQSFKDGRIGGRWKALAIQIPQGFLIVTTTRVQGHVCWRVFFGASKTDSNVVDTIKITLTDKKKVTSQCWKGPVVRLRQKFEYAPCFTVQNEYLQGISEWSLKINLPKRFLQ